MTAILPSGFSEFSKDWAVKIPEEWDDDRFFKFYREHNQFRIERDADGTIHIYPPLPLPD